MMTGKLYLLHLSDIHFTSERENNHVFEKASALVNAIRNEFLPGDSVFVTVTGDIAFSGAETEYLHAMDFFDFLRRELISYHNNQIIIKYILVPGNHDCLFEPATEKTRNLHIDDYLRMNVLEPGDLDILCQPQLKYRDFRSSFEDENSRVVNTDIYTQYNYNISGNDVLFHCFNTAFASQICETQGMKTFPCEMIPGLKRSPQAISISLMHHNFNWFQCDNAREFRRLIKDNSDLLLVGHEHCASMERSHDILLGAHVDIIEGAVLQENGKPDVSGFNLVEIDLRRQSEQLRSYIWCPEESLYLPTDNALTQKLNVSLANNKFIFNQVYYDDFLTDVGALISHPRKEKVKLNDFFVYPSFKDVKIRNRNTVILDDVVSGEDICQSVLTGLNLISGDENSGKTTFAKVVIRTAYDAGMIPVLINGEMVRKNSAENCKKLIDQAVHKQYKINGSIENFHQLNKADVLIVVDDLDEVKLNTDGKLKFLEHLTGSYENILVTVKGVFKIEEHLSSENSFFVNNSCHYEINEFGHESRDSIIRKWTLLGQEEKVEEEALYHIIHDLSCVINTVIGNNYIPSYPIFVYTILQANEVGVMQDVESSSGYGYYYSCMITLALSKVVKEKEDMELYFNYLSELAFYLYQIEGKSVNNEGFEQFHESYLRNYKISRSDLKLDDTLLSLVKVRILKDDDGVFSFKYRYIYYFFVAKFLSDNIEEDEVREIVRKLSFSLYLEESANIIIFLTHHSKSNFIQSCLLEKSKKLFENHEPVKLDGDVKLFENLINELPQIVYTERDVDETRREQLRAKDHKASDEEKKEDVDEFSILSQINSVTKTVEIFGQILKNHYGSLKGDKKVFLAEEGYQAPLRCLKYLLELFSEQYESLKNEIEHFIEEKGLKDKEEVQRAVREMIFGFSSMLTYGFIKKTARSLGFEKLKAVFVDVLEMHDSNSYKLIDFLIKLEHYKSFPMKECESLYKKFESSPLCIFLLKRSVVDYLYMFPVGYQKKQKICDLLGISMKTQRLIDHTTTQRKRS